MSLSCDGGPVMLGVNDKGAVLKSGTAGSVEEYLLERGRTFGNQFKAVLYGIFGQGVFLANVKANGHTGFNKYFLFRCPDCRQLQVSYAKGFDGYLTCGPCEARYLKGRQLELTGFQGD